MVECKKCGVELEKNMRYCPLCGQAVDQEPVKEPEPVKTREPMTQPERVRVWEIISITLLSAIVAALAINYIHIGRISWSEYPVAVSLVIFSYVSLIAFWRQRPYFQLAGGLVLSAVLLVVFDFLTGSFSWSLQIALPLLIGYNLIGAIFLGVVLISKYKGINLIAWGFIAVAAICMVTEAVQIRYIAGSIQLHWSLIVAACILPVILVLLFLHYRFKRGMSLQKTFHV